MAKQLAESEKSVGCLWGGHVSETLTLLYRSVRVALVVVCAVAYPRPGDASVEVRNLSDHVLEYVAAAGSGAADVLEFNRSVGGESVALIVGTGDYEHVGKLGYVPDDACNLAEFLVNEQGYSRVLVMLDRDASPDLARHYLLNSLGPSMKTRDRLLVYFIGHGADLGGKTGYYLFWNANPQVDRVKGVLKIKDCIDWSSQILEGNVLFVFDACASGLEFAVMGIGTPPDLQIARSRNGERSRMVMTAGSGGEQTVGIDCGAGRLESVFTHCFIESIKSQGRDESSYLTAGEVYEGLCRLEGAKLDGAGIRVHPQRWPIAPDMYPGGYLFFNRKVGIAGLGLPAMPVGAVMKMGYGAPLVNKCPERITLQISDVNIRDFQDRNIAGKFVLSAEITATTGQGRVVTLA